MNEIVIDPITRIEGHSKITIQLDEAGAVTDAHFHVTQFRGFERICEGRPLREMPSLMARICGICPVSHLMARRRRATRSSPSRRRTLALSCGGYEPGPDRAVPRAQLLPPLVARPAVRLRRRPGRRNLFGVAADHPQLARDGIALRRSASRSSNVSAASGSIRRGWWPAG